MALSEFDRNLLQRCLAREPRSWENFVDRFLGLVLHVLNHTAAARSMQLTEQDREDLVAEVFLAIVNDDFAVLRRFRGQSSLATYLTVVARRVVVRELLKRNLLASATQLASSAGELSDSGSHEQRIHDQDQVAQLLQGLPQADADVVRMYHIEGKSYQEISQAVGMPENSVGPTLSRARGKLRSKSTT